MNYIIMPGGLATDPATGKALAVPGFVFRQGIDYALAVRRIKK